MRKHGSEHKCYSCGRNVACGVFNEVDDDGVAAEYWICDSCAEDYFSDNNYPEPETCGYCGCEVIVDEERICPECGQPVDGW